MSRLRQARGDLATPIEVKIRKAISELVSIEYPSGTDFSSRRKEALRHLTEALDIVGEVIDEQIRWAFTSDDRGRPLSVSAAGDALAAAEDAYRDALEREQEARSREIAIAASDKGKP